LTSRARVIGFGHHWGGANDDPGTGDSAARAAGRGGRSVSPSRLAATVSPLLIGRASELAALSEAVERPGGGAVLLVSGEPGIGKSRLISAFLDEARFACLRVACLEPDHSEPYAVLSDLLAGAGVKAADVPWEGQEAQAQTRKALRLVREALDRFGAGRTAVLAIEDVQWADTPSLQVLLALARDAHGLALLLSYRTDSMAPALAAFLDDLNRLRVASEVPLGPLSPADVGRMAVALLGGGVLPPGFVEELMRFTEGNPFLIEEVVRSFVDSGALFSAADGWHRDRALPLEAPSSLRHAVEARLQQLPAKAAALCRLAAVVGHSPDPALLREVSGLDEQEFVDLLRLLADAHFLRPGPDASISFRHSLTRASVLSSLLQPERALLHRRVAAALEGKDEAPLAALAYHWSQAGDADRAGDYGRRAGDHAARLNAHREAIAGYSLALAGGAGDPSHVLAAIGNEYSALGELDDGLAYYRQAKERRPNDDEFHALLDLRAGMALSRDRRRVEAVTYLEKALSALAPEHEDRWLAGMTLALQYAAQGRYAEAESTLRHALEGAGVPTLGRLRLTYELGGLRALHGDWAALDDAGSLVLKEVSDDTDTALALRYDAHAALGTVAYYRGAFESAATHFRGCLSIADQRGLETDRGLALWNLSTNALYNLGRWQEARAILANCRPSDAWPSLPRPFCSICGWRDSGSRQPRHGSRPGRRSCCRQATWKSILRTAVVSSTC
jgi:tetratricopeptide (TPR) repeat protein